VLPLCREKEFAVNCVTPNIKEVEEVIASGSEAGWAKVSVTRKVGKNDKFLKAYGKEEGEKVTYAYKHAKSKAVSFSPSEGYDVQHYLKDFREKAKEVFDVLEVRNLLNH